MNSQLAEVSNYLLRLYAQSTGADASAYTTFALDGVSQLLGADKAWWGVISISELGPHLFGSFRSRLPSHWEAAWEKVKDDDSVAKALAQRKNQSISLEFASAPGRKSRLSEMAEEFDIREALSVAVEIPNQNSFMFISYYRNCGRSRFSPEDKSINQLLAPHLYATWQRNIHERLRNGDEDEAGHPYKAFVDRDGRLVQYEAGFGAVLSKHWHSWRGLLLPLILREAIERSRAATGGWIGVDSWTVRTTPAGLWTLVELREANALDRLRPRELQVARLFGEGANHKEVARLTGLTPSTVRHYLREVYAKLGIDNKAALANLLSRRGG